MQVLRISKGKIDVVVKKILTVVTYSSKFLTLNLYILYIRNRRIS